MATVRLVRNVALGDAATSTQTSNIDEPTTAMSGDNVFYTGNWFASLSTNGGTSWSLVDPFTKFPAAAGGFCCDQIVLYDATRDIWIWILQYSAKDGNNIFRVAISRGATFGSWYWWDFSPKSLNSAWTDMWFDYPDAAISNNNLYIAFNAFNGARSWLLLSRNRTCRVHGRPRGPHAGVEGMDRDHLPRRPRRGQRVVRVAAGGRAAGSHRHPVRRGSRGVSPSGNRSRLSSVGCASATRTRRSCRGRG